MTLRRLKIWLYLATVTLLLAAAGVMLWAALAPCPGNGTTAKQPGRHESENSAGQLDETPPLEAFQPLFDRKFRRPLFDPPPVKPPEPVVKKKPPPPVKLMATMIEATGNQAMFSATGGEILIRRVGELIAAGDSSAEVVEIDPNRVVLEYEGERITLKIE